MSKSIIVADYQYISPHTAKRGGAKHLRGKLKYLQYRDDRYHHIKQDRYNPRWVDQGLGSGYGEILHACETSQSKDVLAWTWMISPAPDLMALVPESQRRELLHGLTQQIVMDYYEARGVDIPPYSYVMHDRQTEAGDQQLHTHVILPGTVETLSGREAFYNNKREGHVALFNEIAAQAFEQALDREIGVDWRRLRDVPKPPQPEADDSLEAWFSSP